MYDPDGEDAPEGGYGWLVLLGAFLSQFALFGIMFSWYVFPPRYAQATSKHLEAITVKTHSSPQ